MREMDKRFEAVDQRLETLAREMDQRFEALMREMDKRFEAVDQRFDALQRQIAFMQWMFSVWLTLLSVLAGWIAFFK